MHDFEKELEVARRACRQAGVRVLHHYGKESAAPTRKADDSPVTRADLEANDIILDILTAAFPDDAILSEESTDDKRRLQCDRVWIVDPIDGTRDFIHQTGDFAVHVGLAIAGVATVGVVYKPVGDEMYEAVLGHGAYVCANQTRTRLQVSSIREFSRFRVGTTRFALNSNLQRFVDESGLADSVFPIGASIKMMALARGKIEMSLCLSDVEKEWDTCAPSVIVSEAGGVVTDIDGLGFRYNNVDVYHRRGILMSNGAIHQQLVDRARPYYPTDRSEQV